MLPKRKEPTPKKSIAEALMRDLQGSAAEKLVMFQKMRAAGAFAKEDPVELAKAEEMLRTFAAMEKGEPIGEVAMGGPEDPLAAYAGDPGAEIFRACVACHTLKADEGARAGPTLAGIFGRRIATLPGYDFSAALKKLDIVWTPQTVSKLFEMGPAAYTPGTKMPEQRVGSAEDRAALTKFLEKATNMR
jgi:cytochrome c